MNEIGHSQTYLQQKKCGNWDALFAPPNFLPLHAHWINPFVYGTVYNKFEI